MLPNNEGSSFRAMLLAVAVATAGVFPAFLTGGLAIQVRGAFGFGEGALGLAVAVFFATSALASTVFGRVVERVGSYRGMRLAVLVSAASLLAISALASSWWGLVACLVLGGFGNAISRPSTHLLLARQIPQNRQGLAFGVKQAAIPAATLLAGLAVPLVATTAGWRWPGLFNFAIVRTNPGALAAATGITQTGASSGAAAGPLAFGYIVEGTSYGTAWMVSGAVALVAADGHPRRTTHAPARRKGYRRPVSTILYPRSWASR